MPHILLLMFLYRICIISDLARQNSCVDPPLPILGMLLQEGLRNPSGFSCKSALAGSILKCVQKLWRCCFQILHGVKTSYHREMLCTLILSPKHLHCTFTAKCHQLVWATCTLVFISLTLYLTSLFSADCWECLKENTCSMNTVILLRTLRIAAYT